MGLLACERDEPVIYRVPEVAGVAASVDSGQQDSLTLVFTNGEQVVLDRSGLDTPVGGGPRVGELVLAGHESERPWVTGVRLTETRGLPAGCYRVFSMGRDEGATIALDVGLRLQKAPSFDPGIATDGQYTFSAGSFCLNEQGDVTSYQP